MYRRAAEGVRGALLAVHPELKVILNPEKPRKKSFDITLIDGGKGKEEGVFCICLVSLNLGNRCIVVFLQIV